MFISWKWFSAKSLFCCTYISLKYKISNCLTFNCILRFLIHRIDLRNSILKASFFSSLLLACSSVSLITLNMESSISPIELIRSWVISLMTSSGLLSVTFRFSISATQCLSNTSSIWRSWRFWTQFKFLFSLFYQHDSYNCHVARPMLRLCASMLRLCPTHVATLRDPCCDFVRPMLRLCTTQASCGTMKFRSQKVHFGYPFRSQHESWNSARVDPGADLWGGGIAFW